MLSTVAALGDVQGVVAGREALELEAAVRARFLARADAGPADERELRLAASRLKAHLAYQLDLGAREGLATLVLHDPAGREAAAQHHVQALRRLGLQGDAPDGPRFVVGVLHREGLAIAGREPSRGERAVAAGAEGGVAPHHGEEGARARSPRGGQTADGTLDRQPPLVDDPAREGGGAGEDHVLGLGGAGSDPHRVAAPRDVGRVVG